MLKSYFFFTYLVFSISNCYQSSANGSHIFLVSSLYFFILNACPIIKILVINRKTSFVLNDLKFIIINHMFKHLYKWSITFWWVLTFPIKMFCHIYHYFFSSNSGWISFILALGDKVSARYGQKDLEKCIMYLYANMGNLEHFMKRLRKIRKINHIHILKKQILPSQMCLSQVDCCAC